MPHNSRSEQPPSIHAPPQTLTGPWRRGSIAVEAALLLPVVVMVFGVLAQVMIFSKHRTLAEQAAFAAGRSALTQICPEQILLLTPESLFRNACVPNPHAWENAARWALVPAAPASGRGGYGDSCPESGLSTDIFAAAGLSQGLNTAFRNKVCYTFAAGNLLVEIDELSGPRDPSLPDYAAVRATVRFKFPISSPIGLFMSDGRHPDGSPWKWGQATMVVS
jgi:hypothetical protein